MDDLPLDLLTHISLFGLQLQCFDPTRHSPFCCSVPGCLVNTVADPSCTSHAFHLAVMQHIFAHLPVAYDPQAKPAHLTSALTLACCCKSFNKHFSVNWWKTLLQKLNFPALDQNASPQDYQHLAQACLNFGFDTSLWTSRLGCSHYHRFVDDRLISVEGDRQSSNDIAVALIGFPLTSGRVYIEIIVESQGSEIYFGVTNEPQTVAKVRNSEIINHPNIWAFTDGGRADFYLAGRAEAIGGRSLDVWNPDPNWKRLDKIGCFIDMDNFQISWFVNHVKKGETKPLPPHPSYQAWLFTDTAIDKILLNQVVWVPKGQELPWTPEQLQ